MLVNATAIIILQYISGSNQHIVHLKLIQCICQLHNNKGGKLNKENTNILSLKVCDTSKYLQISLWEFQCFFKTPTLKAYLILQHNSVPDMPLAIQ